MRQDQAKNRILECFKNISDWYSPGKILHDIYPNGYNREQNYEVREYLELIRRDGYITKSEGSTSYKLNITGRSFKESGGYYSEPKTSQPEIDAILSNDIVTEKKNWLKRNQYIIATIVGVCVVINIIAKVLGWY